MPMFNLDNYETVEDRLIRFWADHPEGRIYTSIVHYDDNKVVFKAEIYFGSEDAHPKATGFAEEIRGASPVNKTSHLENGETSAIGRGLANCGYAAKGSRPSREEMSKVVRNTSLSEVQEFIDNTQQNREEMVLSAFPDSRVVKPKGPITIKNPGQPASQAQMGKIRAELFKLGIKPEAQTEFVSNVLERELMSMSELTKGDASRVIDQLLNG